MIYIRFVALVSAALLLTGCQTRTSPLTRDEPPTVLIVTVDTLRADRLGAYGKEGAGTPTLDRLAQEGTLFESAHTTAPLTLPGHASILTGRSVPAHGVRNNGTYALSPEIPTIAERFKDAGWSTGAFVSAQVLARRHGLDRGFDRYDDRVGGISGARGLVAHYVERSGVETVDRAVTWMIQQQDKPIMSWVHIWEPHVPYSPPAEFAEKFPDDLYQGEVSAADAAIGRLIEGARTAGRTGPMLVIVTSDHGESLWEHDEETHGLFLYRGVMQVPLIISGPDWGIPAQRLDVPVSVADIAPTLTKLCELEVLDGADGLPLADAMIEGVEIQREGVFAESWLPKIDFQWSGLRAMVTRDRKLIHAPRRELYDVLTDPGELDDLYAGTDESERQRLLQMLEEFVDDGLAVRPEGGSITSASEEDLAALRSLGYAATGAVAMDDTLVDEDGVDPKDRVEVIGKHDQAVKYLVEGKAEEARALLEEALTVDRDNPALLFQLSAAFALLRQPEASLPVLERLVELQPESGFAWLRYGQVLGAVGRRDQEESAYRKALEVDPYNITTYRALAQSLAVSGRRDEAIDLLELAQTMDPGNDALAEQLGRLKAR